MCTLDNAPFPPATDATYTEEQRAALAAAFKAAKLYLDDHGFLCCALDKASRVDHTLKAACDLAAILISSRLRGAYTVTTWLVDEGHASEAASGSTDLLPYRHRWLDSLIAEFSND